MASKCMAQKRCWNAQAQAAAQAHSGYLTIPQYLNVFIGWHGSNYGRIQFEDSKHKTRVHSPKGRGRFARGASV